MAPVEGGEWFGSWKYHKDAPPPAGITSKPKETDVSNVDQIQPSNDSDLYMNRIPGGLQRTNDNTTASQSYLKDNHAKNDPSKGAMGDLQKPLEAVRKPETEYQSQARDSRKESDVVQEAHADNSPTPPDKQKTNEIMMDSKPTQPGRVLATHAENRAKRSRDQAQRDHQKQLAFLRKRVSEHQEQLRQVCDERDISRDELARAQKDIAALRDQVKLNDETEPSEAVSKFDQILVAIRDICFSISDAFVGISRLTTNDMNANSKIWQDLLTVPLQSLWQFGVGKNWPLYELLEHSMCMIINSRLDEAIFARFHPHLKPEQPESKVIADIYAEIRAAAPQIVSGTFRVNLFKGIDRLYGDHQEELACQFVQAVRQDWTNMLACLPQSNHNHDILDTHTEALRKIYFKVYRWNSSVKAHCISLDFHPEIAKPHTHFDEEKMNSRIHGDRRPRKIIGTVGFGLFSSAAAGKGQSPKYVCQTRAVVLSDLYFLQNN